MNKHYSRQLGSRVIRAFSYVEKPFSFSDLAVPFVAASYPTAQWIVTTARCPFREVVLTLFSLRMAGCWLVQCDSSLVSSVDLQSTC